MPEEKTTGHHSLIMENRKMLTMTGVKDVRNFDEQTVVMITQMGEITVRGDGLHIEGFNRESGDLSMNGEIYAIVYTDDRKTGGSFMSRIFR